MSLAVPSPATTCITNTHTHTAQAEAANASPLVDNKINIVSQPM